MTHEDLNELGPQLEKRCNEAIAQGLPTWSRYAVDQMVERTMEKIAPNWEYKVMRTVGGTPERLSVILTQYRGQVGPVFVGTLMTYGGERDIYR